VQQKLRMLLTLCLFLSAASAAGAQDTIRKNDDAFIDLQFRYDPSAPIGDVIKYRYTQKTTSFDFIQYGGFERPRFILLKKVVRSTTQTYGQEFAVLVDRFVVTAYEVEGHARGAALYSLPVVPDDHDQYTDLAVAEEDGGLLRIYTGARRDPDPEANLPAGPFRYYDIRTGRLLSLADGEDSLAKVFLKDAQRPARYIGATAQHPVFFASDIDPDHGYVATVTYGSNQGILDRAVIAASDAARNAAKLPWYDLALQVTLALPGTQGKAPLSSVVAGGNDSETFNNMSVWVELAPEIDVEIPLVNDRLALDRAILPAGFSIARVAPDAAMDWLLKVK